MILSCSNCGFRLSSLDMREEEIKCKCLKYSYKKNSSALIVIRCNESALEKAYVSEYRNIADQDLVASIQLESYLEKKAYFDFLNLGNVGGIDVLEIGPGQGHLAKKIFEAGANLTIADVIPQYLETIQRKIDVKSLVVDVQKLGVSESFDLIIMCDVLEHVFRPSDALLSAWFALKPGGKLYIRVPSNESNIFYSNNLGYPYELVHLRTYSRSLLTRELLASGFSVEKNNFLFETKSRIPRNWVPGTKRYWKIKRALIANYEQADMKFTTFDKITEGLLQARFNDSHRFVNFVLNISKYLYTQPVEIVALAIKPK